MLCSLTLATSALLGWSPLEASRFPDVSVTDSSQTEIVTLSNADFEVDFENFDVPTRNAFMHACALWSEILDISVPIHVSVTWIPGTQSVQAFGLPGQVHCGSGSVTLGSAAPVSGECNFNNTPLDDFIYPAALANQLAGTDLREGDPDIVMQLNGCVNFYLGTDGNPELDQYDLVTVVMHELGHGMGFFGSESVDVSSGQPEGELLTNGGGLFTCNNNPLIYDRFVQVGPSSTNGTPILDLEGDGAALYAAFTGENLHWNGSNATYAYADELLPIYAPPTWNDGSSYSHFDLVPALMRKSITPGISRRPTLYDITALQDMGWPLNDCPKQWHVPNPQHSQVDNQPAIYACQAPPRYVTVNQACVESVLNDPSVYQNNSWNAACIEAYHCCIDRGCSLPSMCNYDPGACTTDNTLCLDCLDGVDGLDNHCVRIAMQSENPEGWEIPDGLATNSYSAIPEGGTVIARWVIADASQGFAVAEGTLTRPEGSLDFSNSPSEGIDALCLPSGCYVLEVTCEPLSEFSTFNCNAISTTVFGINEHGGEFGSPGTFSLPFSVGESEYALGCINPDACNYDDQACVDDGSCILTEGCTDFLACNYNEEACVDDGSCEVCAFNLFSHNCFTIETNSINGPTLGGTWSISTADGPFPVTLDGGELPKLSQDLGAGCFEDGCYLLNIEPTGLFAANYQWTIQGIDGGMLSGSGAASFPISFGGAGGCTDFNACNYDPEACHSVNQLCTYPGCNDPGACNYSPNAGTCGSVACVYPEVYITVNTNSGVGTVVFPEGSGGCTNPLAPNYDANAVFEDGTCILSYLCGPGTYFDEQLGTCLPNTCLGDFNGNGQVGTEDLLTFLSNYGQSCD